MELVRLAGFDPPVAADMEILAPDGSMAGAEPLRALADRHALRVVSVEQLQGHVPVTRSVDGPRAANPADPRA